MASVNSFTSDPGFHSAEIYVIFRLTQFSCVLDSEYKSLIFPMENCHLEIKQPWPPMENIQISLGQYKQFYKMIFSCHFCSEDIQAMT